MRRTDKRKFAAVLAGLGLSQGRLATMLGMSKATLQRRIQGVSMWRDREVTILWRVLGCDIAELATPSADEVLSLLPSPPPAESKDEGLFQVSGDEEGCSP